MTQFNTMADLIRISEEENQPFYEIVIARECETEQRSRQAVFADMLRLWEIMRASVERGRESEEKSSSGMVGGDAKKLYAYRAESYLGETAGAAAAYAVAVNEVNASMGRIVACPTAGSCGIVPAALYAAQEKKGFSQTDMVCALFTAAGIGMIVDHNACIAGAAGGCQAECGTAAAMAAGALAQLDGGGAREIGNAAALAMKNLLGLACDPVAGLVEVPCVKRNGFCAVHAMLAADMTRAGVVSVIPVDEVIEAMYRIGRAMPRSLRETAEGGLATTATGRAIQERIYPKRQERNKE